MFLYRTEAGWFVHGTPVPEQSTTREDLYEYLQDVARSARTPAPLPDRLLAPIEAQEVWAAGVTYYRSRSARMSESQSAGGGDFYDRVYSAERPELFMKAMPHRVVG